MFNFWTLNVPVPLGPALPLFEQALVARLQAAPGVVDLLGDRIYPNHLPQSHVLETGPAATYKIISKITDADLTGAAGITRARVQVSALSRDYGVAKRVVKAIRGAVPVGFRGDLGGGIVVTGTLQSDESDLDIPPADASDRWTYQVVFDLKINFLEN